MTTTVPQNDLAVLRLLMQYGSLSISEMETHLGVTATAVRQRLNRLLSSGLISRDQVSEGRGRPSHKYSVTQAGRKTAGDNQSDLAGAMWQEIQAIEDPEIRKKVISGTISRLVEGYEPRIEGATVEERLSSAAKLFAERDIPIVVDHENGLPILRILSCPYPDLDNENHEVCEMEQELFSRVVGGPVELCECSLDGNGCCSFQADQQKKQITQSIE